MKQFPKINFIVHSVQQELSNWAKLSMETKFGVALVLLVLAFIFGGYISVLSSALNVWGVIIFFEALLQSKLKWEKEDTRKILKTYLYAGILGTIAGSFLLLYFDVFYFLHLSIIDFLTRYIWFLLPLSKLHVFSSPQMRGGSALGGGGVENTTKPKQKRL